MSPRLTPRTDDRGVTAVEYALIVFLVGIGMLIGVVLMTRSFSAAFAASADQAGGSTSSPAVTECPSDGEDHEDDDDCDDQGSNGENNGVSNGESNGTPSRPGAPTGVTAQRTADGQITVSWTAPGSNGGRAITGYTVEFETESQVTTCDSTVTGWNNGSVTAQGSASSAAKSGLGSNWYCVRVYATNGVTSGATNYAYAGPVYSAVTKPGDPSGLALAWTTAGTIDASWTPPVDNGGATVSYDIQWDSVSQSTNCANNNYNGGGSSTSSSAAKSIASLTASNWYCVAVRATNSAGDSNWIYAGPFKPGPSAPGAPTIDSVTRGNGQVSVAFTAPTDNGGAAITNYKYSTNGGSNWSTRSPASTASPLVLTGLTNGTPYNVVILAVNSAGDGTASNSMSATPATTPGAPTIGTITRGNQQLSVAFTAGATGGSAITNYEYSSDGGATWTTRSPASTSSPVVITGLTNGTSYPVQLRAVNAVGIGTASTSSSATPKAPYTGSTPSASYGTYHVGSGDTFRLSSGAGIAIPNSTYVLEGTCSGNGCGRFSFSGDTFTFNGGQNNAWGSRAATVTVTWSVAATNTTEGASQNFTISFD